MRKLLVAVAVLTVIAAPAPAAPQLERLSWFAQSHSYISFAVYQDLVYAQAPNGMLEIFAIDGDHFELLRSFAFFSDDDMRILAMIEGYLLTGTLQWSYESQVRSLTLFNLDDPLAPVFATAIPYENSVGGICYCPPYLYFSGEPAVDQYRLIVYCLADPLHPHESGSLALPEATSYIFPGLAQRCGSLILTDDIGLRVLDISDPVRPQFRGAYRPGGYSRSVIADGDIAIVGAFGATDIVEIVDISDPWTPIPVSDIEWNGSSKLIAFHDRLLAFCDADDGILHLYDLSEPSQPRETASLPLSSSDYYAYFEDDQLLLLGPAGRMLIDVSQPAAPVILDDQAATLGWVDACAWDTYVALANDHGYTIYDVSEPARPVSVSTWPKSSTDFHPTILYYDADWLLAAGKNGLEITEVSSPATPQPLGFLATTAQIFAVAAAQPYAYFTYDFRYPCDYLLHIADLADPANPQESGSIEVTHEIASLVRYRDILYAGCFRNWYVGDPGFILLFDVSDPAQPALLSTIDTGDSPSSVLVAGEDRLYAADQYQYYYSFPGAKMAVYDIGDPRTPALLGIADMTVDSLIAPGAGLLVRGAATIVAYDAAALPELVERSAFSPAYFNLTSLMTNADGVIIGVWGAKAGTFRVTETPLTFIGSALTGESDLTIRAWTSNPGITQIELIYDGLGTGVFLAREEDGNFSLQLPLSGGEQPGRYLLGMRGEGNDFWRPDWPYLDVP